MIFNIFKKRLKTNTTFFVFAFLFIVNITAQKKKEVLFYIEAEKVYTDEFYRIYNKNKDIVIDKEHKDFDSYLNLFIDYKLKLKEAKDLKLDTASTYKSELIKYREQLVEPYLQNPNAVDKLSLEAYNRMLYEIKASHILIKLKPDALPADTLKAHRKILEARTKIINGEPFEQVAKAYSEDPSAIKNGGNLGYFTVFQMVYPFESMAYNTKIGTVSLPFKTQFGYHIIQVYDKRKSKGEVEVAHIMIKHNMKDSLYAKNKIFDIYYKLNQNGDFAKIAKEHSDDKGSALKGGIMPKFGSGKMIKPFDTVAFNLKNEGDFSQPFKTKYGWHILKLIKKHPIKDYNDLKPYLEGKVKNGNRSTYIESDLVKRISKDYSINKNTKLLNRLLQSGKMQENDTEIILSVNNVNYTVNDFNKHLSKQKNVGILEGFSDFKNKKIIEYYKNHLEETNADFKGIYQEYKDGLLLFDLLQTKIWDKSEKDTLGLLNFYNQNKEKYTWRKRGDLIIGRCTNLEKAKQVRAYLSQNKTIDEIKKLINDGATIHVLFSAGVLEEGSSKLPAHFKISETGVSQIINGKKNQYTIVKVNKIIPPQTKKIKETKGELINDYQKYLEEQWVKGLRNKYKIRFNKRALKKLKKDFEKT